MIHKKISLSNKNYKPLPSYLAIGPSDIHGAGIIAMEDIPAEIVIGITHVYDPDFENEYMRTPLGGFLNHNENPNCELFIDDDSPNYKKLRTIKKIEAKDELTVKYQWYKPKN